MEGDIEMEKQVERNNGGKEKENKNLVIKDSEMDVSEEVIISQEGVMMETENKESEMGDKKITGAKDSEDKTKRKEKTQKKKKGEQTEEGNKKREMWWTNGNQEGEKNFKEQWILGKEEKSLNTSRDEERLEEAKNVERSRIKRKLNKEIERKK